MSRKHYCSDFYANFLNLSGNSSEGFDSTTSTDREFTVTSRYRQKGVSRLSPSANSGMAEVMGLERESMGLNGTE